MYHWSMPQTWMFLYAYVLIITFIGNHAAFTLSFPRTEEGHAFCFIEWTNMFVYKTVMNHAVSLIDWKYSAIDINGDCNYF